MRIHQWRPTPRKPSARAHSKVTRASAKGAIARKGKKRRTRAGKLPIAVKGRAAAKAAKATRKSRPSTGTKAAPVPKAIQRPITLATKPFDWRDDEQPVDHKV